MIEAGNQIRAARALVGWSQDDLAGAAGLHVNSVKTWEARERIGPGHAVAAMHTAFEGQGVRFCDGGATLAQAA